MKPRIFSIAMLLLGIGLVIGFIFTVTSGATAQQDSDNPDTLLEQALALEAERNPVKTDTVTMPSSSLGVTNPLFVGVDDVMVPTYRIDPATTISTTAFSGFQVWGAAYDTDNDLVYFNNGSTLYRWQVGGAITTLGTIMDPGGASQAMVSLAFYDGTLYGTKNIANEAVWIINPNTLVATVYIDYVDADYDFGGLAIDPNTGIIYGTNDDTTPHGSGLFQINLDGTATLIAPYPAGQTDIDGLAVSHDGYAYLVIDEPGDIFVYDFSLGNYTTPIPNPWTTSEVFSAGTWLYELYVVSISLNKTVGTSPAVCATTDNIVVTPGTDVYYCYEITNTGTVPLTVHDLEDTQLGTLLNGFNYTLSPGASAFLTATANITQTTINTATWTAYNPGPIDVISATDTATVEVFPSCPGGFTPVIIESVDFEIFPPPNWTLTNTTTGCTAPGVPDWTNTDPGGRGNLTGGQGAFAIADSDACGSGSVMTATMITGALDFTGIAFPQVSFYMDYNDISSASDVANVDVSTDGGSSWNNLLTWNADARGPLFVYTPLPGAGENDVQIRWDYQNATWDWWWEVDEVVIAGCIPPTPELELTKTVGTDPGQCATTDAIDVPSGTDVTYCYTINNTGSITVTTHDLVDDQLGSLLTGFAYNLAPGASVFLTATITITEDTLNVASWTGTTIYSDSITVTDTATVSIIEFDLYLPIISKTAPTANLPETNQPLVWLPWLALGSAIVFGIRRKDNQNR